MPSPVLMEHKMRIDEKIDRYLNESPKAKRALEAEFEKIKSKGHKKTYKLLPALGEKVEAEFSKGNITAQEAENLTKKIKLFYEVMSWSGSYR